MKHWRSILLKVAVVAGALGVAGLVAFRLGTRQAEARGPDPSPIPAATAAGAALEPPHVDISRSSVGTFLGVADDIALQHIRKAPIAEVKFNKGGSSISFRLTFTDGSRAAFKPLQTNPQTVPRKEVAAYRLNRLLGLTAVAPATQRTLSHDDIVNHLAADQHWTLRRIEAETLFDDKGLTTGEVSYWIPTIVDSHLDSSEAIVQWTGWLTVGEEIPAPKRHLMEQLSTLLVFDFLENNSDRWSGGNLMLSLDGETLYYMDNTFGFQLDRDGHQRCQLYLQRSQKFSRALVARMRHLDAAAIHAALATEPAVLTDDEIRALLARNLWALRYIDGLIAAHGEDRVLVFD